MWRMMIEAAQERLEKGKGVMAGANDIIDRLEAAADTVPEDLSALLIEAADEIRHLRELLSFAAGTELEGVKPQGNA